MKNTHILIPIKDIEEYFRKSVHAALTKEISLGAEVLSTSKQISLNEEDIVIEKKANKFYKSANDSIIDGFVDGYKQALRDIIK